MKLQLGIFTFIIMFLSCHAKNKSNQKNVVAINTTKAITISIKLAPSSNFSLNYHSLTPPSNLYFDNQSKNDSIIIKHIYIDRITEFVYFADSIDRQGNVSVFEKKLLLSPGDSIIINKEHRIIYSTGLSEYVNYFLTIPDNIFAMVGKKRWNDSSKIDLKKLLDTVENLYQLNKRKIASNQKLDVSIIKILDNYNLLQKYFQIYRLINTNDLDKNEITIMDSINKKVINDSEIFKINSLYTPIVFSNIVKVSAKKNDCASINNFWNCYFSADSNIKHLSIYRCYAFSLLINNFFYNFESKNAGVNNLSLKATYDILTAISIKDTLRDSLLKFANILLETKTDYTKAKRELINFYNGKYAYVFNDDALANHEKKTIANLPNVKLFDVTGNAYDFKNIVMDKKYKLIVVDFWANWCAPCLKETPYYVKAKDKLKNQSIKFVGISIDHQEDEAKWIAVAKKQGLYDDPFQYRMENYTNSPLTTLLQINTIPRYIVFDNNGNIINNDLDRPSSGKFEETILKYL